MFCINCGTQLPDEASYCWKCGKPQGNTLAAEETKWETCEIIFELVKKGGFLNSFDCDVKFLARAIGPDGTYSAGESAVIKGQKQFDCPPPVANTDRYHIADQELEDLTKRLTTDGWEYVGLYSTLNSVHQGGYWMRRFRRRIQLKANT